MACKREKGRGMQCFYGKTLSNETTGKRRHRWEDNIKIHLKNIRLEAMSCSSLYQRPVNTLMKFGITKFSVF